MKYKLDEVIELFDTCLVGLGPRDVKNSVVWGASWRAKLEEPFFVACLIHLALRGSMTNRHYLKKTVDASLVGSISVMVSNFQYLGHQICRCGQ